MLPTSKITNVPARWSGWYEEMESQLLTLEREVGDRIEFIKRALLVCRAAIEKLKNDIQSYLFQSAEEEIYFFKEVKPAFASHLIYYEKLFHLETGRPDGRAALWKPQLNRVMERLQYFFDDHLDFYRYCRSGDSYRDDQYFRRVKGDNYLRPGDYYTGFDASFSTGYDLTLAGIMASEKLYNYVSDCLHQIDSGEEGAIPFSTANRLSWTAAKASLVELLYALQSAGSFNNGVSDLKQVARFFEETFHIELGNYYHVFQEIRLRKKNRTSFLDQLKERLIKRMDEADER